MRGVLVIALCLASWVVLANNVPTSINLDERAIRADAIPAELPNWHFLSQSYGGTISLVKGLTKSECEFMENRAKGRPATSDEKAAQVQVDAKRELHFKQETADYETKHPGCKYAEFKQGCPIEGWVVGTTTLYGPGDIKTAECFQ